MCYKNNQKKQTSGCRYKKKLYLCKPKIEKILIVWILGK